MIEVDTVPSARVDRHPGERRTKGSAWPLWAALTLVYSGLRLWGLTSYGLWADEVFSVRVATVAWPDLFRSVASDAVHPPLFYMLLKLWIGVGGSTALWLKLLPVVFSVAALVPLWLICGELELGRRGKALGFWLVAVNGYLIHYSQELRMYSLLLCMSLWSLWLFFRFLKTTRASLRAVVPLLAVNALLVHTHYFGWLLVGTQWLCVLLWRTRLLGWFSVLAVGLGVVGAPWAYAVAAASGRANALPSSLQWISRPGWGDLVWYVATLNGIIPLRHTTPLGVALFGAPIAVALVRALRQAASSRSVVLLGAVSFLPIGMAFAASVVLTQSVWGERHLIIVAVPYLLTVAVSVFYVERAWMRRSVVVLLVLWSGLALAAGMMRAEDRVPWKGLAQHLIENETASRGPTTVYAFEGWTAAPLEFELADIGSRQIRVVVVGDAGAASAEHFWVVFREPASHAQGDPRGYLEQRGCRFDAERTAENGGQRVVLFRATC